MRNLYSEPCTINNGRKRCFLKSHIIALGSRQTTENSDSEFLLKNIVAMGCTHQIALCYQPCHRGFTVKITDSPNMVCTVNHATEDLQHRILDFSKYCSLHYHIEMEREERLRQRREYRARRDRETEEQRQSRLAKRREYDRRIDMLQ